MTTKGQGMTTTYAELRKGDVFQVPGSLNRWQVAEEPVTGPSPQFINQRRTRLAVWQVRDGYGNPVDDDELRLMTAVPYRQITLIERG
jgi:hypothetical protein